MFDLDIFIASFAVGGVFSTTVCAFLHFGFTVFGDVVASTACSYCKLPCDGSALPYGRIYSNSYTALGLEYNSVV